jgi:hypothetical protein
MDILIARLSVLAAVPAAIILMAACDGTTERENASSNAPRRDRADTAEAPVSARTVPESERTGPAIPADKQQDSKSESERRSAEVDRAAYEASAAWSSEVLGFAFRGESSPLGPYQLIEPRFGEPLQLEYVMVTARPDHTYFIVRLRNVGDGPLEGYFRLVCSTGNGRTGITIEPKGLGRGRTIYQELHIMGESTTQGECALQQEDEWRRFEPS